MVSLLLRILLFLSSYFPAFVILFILLLPESPDFAWGALGAGILGLLGLAATLYHLSRQQAAQSFEVTACHRQDTEAMTYVVSYLVPFVSGTLEGWEMAVAYLVFFVVLGILYANSNLIHVNPMLNLLGYRVFDVELGGQEPSVILISRQRVLVGYTIDVTSAGDAIFFRVPRSSKPDSGGVP